MNNNMSWTERLQSVLSDLLSGFLDQLPAILGAVALLLIGWGLAALLRTVIRRGMEGFSKVLRHLVPRGTQARWHNILQPGLIAGIMFWAVILVFTAAAAQVLGLAVFTAWFDAFFRHLPLILLAALIVIVGVIAGYLVRDTVIGTTAVADSEYRTLAGFAIQATIITMAVVLALDLVGLDITFLVSLAAILVAAVAGGVSLAFGLGARNLVRNLLGVRDLHHQIKEGDRLRIGGFEGHVLELGRRGVLLETQEGRVMVPGHYFSERPYIILMPEDDVD